MAPPPPFGANSAAARDIANVLHPYTDLKTHLEVGPVVISRGKGVRVWDDAGKEYIESVAGLWCASLGFDNERLVQAAVTQMRKLPFYHAFTAKSHEPAIDPAILNADESQSHLPPDDRRRVDRVRSATVGRQSSRSHR